MSKRFDGSIRMTRLSVQEFFDQNASNFDSLYDEKNFVRQIINKIFRKSFKRRFEMTLRECTPIEGKTVLDIGCGTGVYGLSLAALGAKSILGVDFSERMIALANKRAKSQSVQSKCRFEVASFEEYNFVERFDYVIAMGFMDYVEDAEAIIDKVRTVTAVKAMFSFPVDRGILAWQRKVRYRNKCPLYLYRKQELQNLFSGFPSESTRIESIGRDYFVTVQQPQ